MHVSISSIKDWRRGTHAPSDFEKVEDIACWAHIDVADLLIESEDRTMDEIFVRLLGLCDIMAETAFGEDDGKWLPDPDMIFDPHEDGYVSPMEAAELKCRKLLDEIRNDLLALRPTAGK